MPTPATRPLNEAFAHVTTWVFDLDNTLYPSHCNLFRQIDKRMGAFIGDLLDIDLKQARVIQKTYLHRHGTTLNGLMHEHGISPHDFLDYVHDIDVSVIPPNPTLATLVKALPGRKYVYTNGSMDHAERLEISVVVGGNATTAFVRFKELQRRLGALSP